MANSGTVYSSYGRNSRVYVSWSVAETDITNNRWKLNWEAGIIVEKNDYWYSNAVRIDSVYIDGGDSLGSGTYSNIIGTGTYKKLSGSKWISASSDGTKSIAVSISGWFYSYGNVSGSNNFTLPTIPRKATLVTAPNFNDGDNPTITYSNPAGNAVSSLKACISWTGGADIPYREIPKTGSSYTFELTSAERTALRDAAADCNTMTVTFYVTTVIGGTTYYSTLNRTFSIVDARPIVSASVVDTNSTTVALTGNSNKLIKYHSNAKATMSATPQKGASINESMYIIRNGSNTGYGTTHTFNNVESKMFTFSAEDSRGNIGSTIVTVDMVDYIKLTCNISKNRPDAAGKMTVSCSGSYFNGSFGAVSNTLTVQYRYKISGGAFGNWINMSVTKNGNAYYASASLTGLNYQQTYSFETRAIDKLNTITSTESSVKSMPIFHWGENDFVFEVPVTFNAGTNSGVFESGSWTPSLNSSAVSSYSDRQGWYQNINGVVTIGWQIKANINSGYNDTLLTITGAPYTPSCAAFGGGVAHNIYIGSGFCFEGWGINDSGVISARLQPCNNTSAGNLNISSSSYYPSGGGLVTLAGTICYTT